MANIYRKLEGNEVRFVRIRPGAWTDPIRCDLVYLTLPSAESDLVEAWFSGRPLPRTLTAQFPDTRPPGSFPLAEDTSGEYLAAAPTDEIPLFVALSYVWGDSNQTGELLLDGQPVQKTANLIAGLRELRALLGGSSRTPEIFHDDSILFWVDALCINQSDNAEKSAQVPRMGAIFGAAALVVAWLGANEEEDSDIGDLMNVINSITPPDDLGDSDRSSRAFVALQSGTLSRILQAYKCLIRRPWFERMWVVQEAAMSQCTVILAGSHWCYRKSFTGACNALVRVLRHHPEISVDEKRLVQATFHFEIATVMSNTIEHLFELAAGADTSSTTISKTVKKEDCNQRLHDCKERTTGTSGASIFAGWVNEAGSLWEDPVVAKEFLSSRLLAFVLRAAFLIMVSEYKAKIPHDYLYGILSIGGTTKLPRKLAPDYSQRFEDVFHEYSKLILYHTGDLAIIPRMRHELKGVPSWVPDFRSARAFPFTSVGEFSLSVNFDVSISKDGRVCLTRGVYLGEVMFDLNCSGFIGSGNKRAVIGCFDNFLERFCEQERLDKHDVLTKVLEVFCQNSEFGNFGTSQVQDFYDECMSRSPHMVDQGDLSHEDILMEWLSRTVECVCFATSQGLLSSLARHDERPKKGDVLAVLKGADHPWLLRPTIDSDAEEYTFLGACELLYGNPRGSRLMTWNPRHFGRHVEAKERFFAHSEVREFRLV